MITPSKMIMQVHDELVFEIKEELLQDFSQHIKQHMENAATLDVPLIVDIGRGAVRVRPAKTSISSVVV